MKIDKYKQSYKTYLKNYDKYEKKYKSRYKSLYKAPKGGKLSFGEFRTMYEIIKREKHGDSIAIELVNERPKTNIALKPAKVFKETILENIEWQVRNGTLTPVALLRPVELQGATISRASLCNIACLEQMGIEIGHKVMICRCGMIIPKIIKDINTGKYAEGYEL